MKRFLKTRFPPSRRFKRYNKKRKRSKAWLGAVVSVSILVMVTVGLVVLDRIGHFWWWSLSPITFRAGLVEEGIVSRVIDGDTIELDNGMVVRYIGVNTPELRWHANGNWVYRPQRLAEEARAFNESLVLGKRVRIEYDRERLDRYKRYLAYVFIDDLFVNAELIRQGYGRVMLRAPNLKYAGLFERLEREARREHRGVWGVGRERLQERIGNSEGSAAGFARKDG